MEANNKNMKKQTSVTIILLSLGVIAITVLSIQIKDRGGLLGSVTTDTSNTGLTTATTTINTTSTQLLASVVNRATINNLSTSTITCKPDDQGTTAASSTVVANAGYIIGPQGTAGHSPNIVFGNCVAGMQNCYPFKGTLNCVANVAATVTKVTE